MGGPGSRVQGLGNSERGTGTVKDQQTERNDHCLPSNTVCVINPSTYQPEYTTCELSKSLWWSFFFLLWIVIGMETVFIGRIGFLAVYVRHFVFVFCFFF